jgi:hypothetical protein
MAEFIRAQWKSFLVQEGDASLSADAVFSLSAANDTSIREWQFFNNGRLLVIADDHRLITGSFYRQPWQVFIHAVGQSDEDTYYYLFEPVLLMALARLNLLHWHSAAVSVNGKAVLLVGPSGSGKSTTTLRFLDAGYGLIADDEIFLESGAEGVVAFGADEDLYVTDQTLAMFPALDRLKTSPLVRRGHGDKRRVPIQQLFPGAGRDRAAVVRAVLFPTVRAGLETELRALSTPDAMRRFMTHQPKEYPTLVTDAEAAQRRLDIYAALAESARSFEVSLGEHAENLPETMRACLQ